jgi:Protein of unknown function (DUF3780)
VSVQVAQQPQTSSQAPKVKPKLAGFGHAPEQEAHHFVVAIPKGQAADVMIYEVYQEDLVGPQLDASNLRCILNRGKWLKIVDALEEELNRRLRSVNLKAGSFKVGDTPVARLLGKELMLLAWAMEDADPSLAPAAIQNWKGLSPEERWWLYTMTAAQSGHHSKRNVGWRKAVRYALTENPVAAITNVTTAEHKRRAKTAAKQEGQGKLFGFEEAQAPFAGPEGNGIWGEPCQQQQERESRNETPTSIATAKRSSRSSFRSPSSPKSATKSARRTPAKR